jgi:hypothetical protein
MRQVYTRARFGKPFEEEAMKIGRYLLLVLALLAVYAGTHKSATRSEREPVRTSELVPWPPH